MFRFAAFICLSFLMVTVVSAGTAKGTFVLDENTYTISAVLAKTDENPLDRTKKDVLVLLTDKPVEEDQFDVMSLDSMAEAGEIHGILVRLEDARRATGLTVLGTVQRTGEFVCSFDSTAFDLTRVAGRVYLDEPDVTFGRKYTFDIEFDIDVKDNISAAVDESSGTALPPDGGEPGKAYREYEKAMRSGNPAALKKYLVPEQARKLDDPQAANMLVLMSEMRAQNIKIVKGFLLGDRATLSLEGKDPITNNVTRGTAKMRNINGQWVLERENWSSSFN